MKLQCYKKSSFKHPLSNKPFAPLLPLLVIFTMRCICYTVFHNCNSSCRLIRCSLSGCKFGQVPASIISPTIISTKPKKIFEQQDWLQFSCNLNSPKASLSCRTNNEQFTSLIAKATNPGLLNTTFFSHCLFNAESFWPFAAWGPTSCIWAFPLCDLFGYGERILPSSWN